MSTEDNTETGSEPLHLRYRHKKRGSTYDVVGDATLQLEPNVVLRDGDKLKVYVDSNGSVLWARLPTEFHDGRFEGVEADEIQTVYTVASVSTIRAQAFKEAAEITERMMGTYGDGWKNNPKTDGCGGYIAISNATHHLVSRFNDLAGAGYVSTKTAVGNLTYHEARIRTVESAARRVLDAIETCRNSHTEEHSVTAGAELEAAEEHLKYVLSTAEAPEPKDDQRIDLSNADHVSKELIDRVARAMVPILGYPANCNWERIWIGNAMDSPETGSLAYMCRWLAKTAIAATLPTEEKTTHADDIKNAIRKYMTNAGVPESEFDPDFVVKMISAMMVSYHKYGLLRAVYPDRYDATSDVRVRMGKYRDSGNKHYLVDAANFAMIESMHPQPKYNAAYGENDGADSPGRSAISGRRLVSEDNDGNRIVGETILRDQE